MVCNICVVRFEVLVANTIFVFFFTVVSLMLNYLIQRVYIKKYKKFSFSLFHSICTLYSKQYTQYTYSAQAETNIPYNIQQRKKSIFFCVSPYTKMVNYAIKIRNIVCILCIYISNSSV